MVVEGRADLGPWDEQRTVDLSAGPTVVVRRRGTDPLPIVLCHCVALDHRMWDALLAQLPEDLDVLAYRVRNHGPAPDREFDFELCAEDLRELLDLLDVPLIHLAGVSMGGAIAQEFGVAHAERLAGLTLLASSARGRGAAADRRTGELHEQVTPTLRRWFSADFLAGGGPWIDYVSRRIGEWRPQAWELAWAALAVRDMTPRLGEISTPTLCVAGDADRSATVERMADLASRVSGAALEVVSGPHLFVVERPAEVADLLVTHHRGLSARQPPRTPVSRSTEER